MMWFVDSLTGHTEDMRFFLEDWEDLMNLSGDETVIYMLTAGSDTVLQRIVSATSETGRRRKTPVYLQIMFSRESDRDGM